MAIYDPNSASLNILDENSIASASFADNKCATSALVPLSSDNFYNGYASSQADLSCLAHLHNEEVQHRPFSHFSSNFAGLPHHAEDLHHYLFGADQFDATDQPNFGKIDRSAQLKSDLDVAYRSNPHIAYEKYNLAQSSFPGSNRAPSTHQQCSQLSLRSDTNENIEGEKELPYAQLIYKALFNAPNYTLSLREIYDWFEKKTDKANGSETKGWQNSIRHNLSMNGAFIKVDQPGENARKAFKWRLTEEALRNGVKSTTRYRSKQATKRSYRNQGPQPLRQISGAKGGHAAHRSARLRHGDQWIDENHGSSYIACSTPLVYDSMLDNMTSVFEYSPTPSYQGYSQAPPSCQIDDAGQPFERCNLSFHPSQHNHMSSPVPNNTPFIDPQLMFDHSQTTNMCAHSPSPAIDEPSTPSSLIDRTEDFTCIQPYIFAEMTFTDHTG